MTPWVRWIGRSKLFRRLGWKRSVHLKMLRKVIIAWVNGHHLGILTILIVSKGWYRNRLLRMHSWVHWIWRGYERLRIAMARRVEGLMLHPIRMGRDSLRVNWRSLIYLRKTISISRLTLILLANLVYFLIWKFKVVWGTLRWLLHHKSITFWAWHLLLIATSSTFCVVLHSQKTLRYLLALNSLIWFLPIGRRTIVRWQRELLTISEIKWALHFWALIFSRNKLRPLKIVAEI